MTMAHYHAAAWMDHQKALIWQFSATAQESRTVHAQDSHQRIHSRKDEHGGHRAAAAHHFFEDVVQALSGAHEILILGPAQTKQEFVTYLQDKHPQIAKTVVAVESADHPSDAQMLSY